jgi:hypothetical protein
VLSGHEDLNASANLEGSESRTQTASAIISRGRPLRARRACTRGTDGGVRLREGGRRFVR